jgi:hypothetical protein
MVAAPSVDGPSVAAMTTTTAPKSSAFTPSDK